MAKAIHLMPDLLIVLRHAQRHAVVLVVSVQVSIGLLHGHYLADHRISRAAQFGHGVGLECPTDSINPLVDIGVRKIWSLLWLFTFANQPPEIVHATVLLEFSSHGGN